MIDKWECSSDGLMWWGGATDLDHWFDSIHIDELNADQIMSIHRRSGHPGVWHTTYFVRRICPPTTNAAVRSAIWACEDCQLIVPAPIHWEKWKLEVYGNWQRLGMDIMLYGARHFLQLARQNSLTCVSVIAVFDDCPNGHVWHKTFFWWVRVQGWIPHAPGISKNAYGLVSIPLIRGALGAGQ